LANSGEGPMVALYEYGYEHWVP